VPRLVQVGAVTGETLGQSALLLVPLAVGTLVGERVHAAVNEKTFRVAVAGLLVVAGGVLVAGSLSNS
jgi:uncharacterized membrane protein YfcA